MAMLLSRSRYLVRPRGLEGSPWELAAAGLFTATIGGVFGSEILTPDDVISALGLPPLLAAVWTLSGRLAAAVSSIALAVFGILFAIEAPNRTTLATIGVTGLLLAVAVRWYARSLSSVPPASIGGPPVRASREPGVLTRREFEVAKLASQGYTAGEIGVALHISERTVETHLVHIYAKLGVTSKRALVRIGDGLERRFGRDLANPPERFTPRR